MPHRAPQLVEYMRRIQTGENEKDVIVFDRLLHYQENLDQKASSTLTFLGLLLAAVSILLVGGERVTGSLETPFYLGLGILFAAAFVAALLCLSIFHIIGPETNLNAEVDDILEKLARASINRSKRYALALKLTFASAIAFAILVLVYLVILLN